MKFTRNQPSLKPSPPFLLRSFDELSPLFEAHWLGFIHHYILEGQRRSSQYKPVNETQPPTPAHKLFFVLVYDKTTWILADLVFFGCWPTESEVSLPHKKPKGKELTTAQNEANTAHSSRRVIRARFFEC